MMGGLMLKSHCRHRHRWQPSSSSSTIRRGGAGGGLTGAEVMTIAGSFCSSSFLEMEGMTDLPDFSVLLDQVRLGAVLVLDAQGSYALPPSASSMVLFLAQPPGAGAFATRGRLLLSVSEEIEGFFLLGILGFSVVSHACGEIRSWVGSVRWRNSGVLGFECRHFSPRGSSSEAAAVSAVQLLGGSRFLGRRFFRQGRPRSPSARIARRQEPLQLLPCPPSSRRQWATHNLLQHELRILRAKVLREHQAPRRCTRPASATTNSGLVAPPARENLVRQ